MTLDSFAFDNVGFIKIDVEGLRAPGDRGRPNLLVELLVAWHDSRAKIEQISAMLDYDASIVGGGRRVSAGEALAQRPEVVTSNNVLFTPKPTPA